uniref:Uncharacterized protein n=1 Tax=Arundo donax TaxID=35708 RepID=A0A0A9F6L7_ARUDO
MFNSLKYLGLITTWGDKITKPQSMEPGPRKSGGTRIEPR